VLASDVATNVLATALWELGIVPLYRGTAALVTPPNGRGNSWINGEIRSAALHWTATDTPDDVPPDSWRAFLTSDVVRTLIRDVFVFRMDSREASFAEIRSVFEAEWRDFADTEELRAAAVDIDGVFKRLIESVNQLLERAVAEGVLSAHEARATARHRAVDARLDVLERLLRDTGSPRVDLRAVQRFEQQLRSEVGSRYSKIQPPNPLGRERVDIERLYVVPRFSIGGGYAAAVQQQKVLTDPDPIDVDRFLLTLDRRVVLGNPGAGKSTLAGWICHNLARRYTSRIVARRRLSPWIIELRRFAAAREESSQSLVDFFGTWARTSYQLDVPEGAFESLLDRGHLLVVFDGLDELLDTSLRQDVRNEVESFCRRYPATPVLVTSRVVGYAETPLDRHSFDEYHLLDFDLPRVEEYADRWFDLRLADEPAKARTQQVEHFLRDSAVAGDIRNNPLLLGLLASLYRGPGSIPNNLPDVYEACATLLFSTWDKTRNIHVILPFSEHVRPALRELAWWIFNDQQLSSGGVTRRQAIERATDYLARRRFSDPERARVAAEDFIDFCRGRAWVFTDQGSTASGEDLFGFTHRTFLEFFAAEHLAYRKESTAELVDSLVSQIVSEQWDVVCRIAIHIKARRYPDGADDAVRAIYDRVRRRNPRELLAGVRFALRVLQAVIPSPVVSQSLATNVTLAGLHECTDRNAHHQSPSEAPRLLSVLADVGPEVRDEVTAGAARALMGLLADEDPGRRRMGSEFVFRFRDLAREFKYGPVESFWTDVTSTVVATSSARLLELSEEDYAIGCDAWPRLVHLRDLTDSHGLAAAFKGRPSNLGVSMYLSPAGSLIARLSVESAGSPPNDLAELAALGQLFLEPDRPVVRPEGRDVDSLVDLLTHFASSLSFSSRPLTGEAFLGFWAICAVLYDAMTESAALAANSQLASTRTQQLRLFVDDMRHSRSHPCAVVGALFYARITRDEPARKTVLDNLPAMCESPAFVEEWSYGRRAVGGAWHIGAG
jgi:hypothetical protein